MPRSASSTSATTAPSPATVTYFSGCELRHDTREVIFDGQRQPIRRRVFDTLAYLIAQRPRVVPHAELLQVIWKSTSASPKLLARAVMEARRACNDDAEKPKLIVSAHGVGYRFAGAIVEGPSALHDTAAPTAGGLAEARDLLAQAVSAMHAGKHDQAQTYAERALVQAGQAQSHAEKVRALVLCSELALLRGTADAAAKLAAQALQVAQAEGHPPLEAVARVAVADVHLVARNGAVALRHLEQSLKTLSVPGYEADLLTCMLRLTEGFADNGNLDGALAMARSTLARARSSGAVRATLNARKLEIAILGRVGDREAAQGAQAAANALFEEALARSNDLLVDLAGPEHAHHVPAVQYNRARLLEHLGRLDEAWQGLADFHKTTEELYHAQGPVLAERLLAASFLRATLLSRSGEHDQAIQLLHEAFEHAQVQGPSMALAEMCQQASEIALSAGKPLQALEWARKQLQAQNAVHASDAKRLTSILEAERSTGELQAELGRAREQVAALLRENAELRARVASLAGSVPVSPVTGLAGQELLGTVLAASFRHARARGLPMCLGLLELADSGTSADAEPSDPIAPVLLKRAAEVLRAQADIGQPAVQVSPGQVAFHIRDAGLSRAAEVCEAIVAELQRQEWFLLGLAVQPVWRCVMADATTMATPESCVQHLRTRSADARAGAAAEVSAG